MNHISKTFCLLCSLVFFSIHLQAQALEENLPDGARNAYTIYEDERQVYVIGIVVSKAPTSTTQYIYRKDNLEQAYSRFVPWPMFRDVPSGRLYQKSTEPLGRALFQDTKGLVLIEMDFLQGEWREEIRLQQKPSYGWHIDTLSDPRWIIFSYHKRDYRFELALLNSETGENKVIVTDIERRNHVVSSNGPSLPFIIYRDHYVFYPVTCYYGNPPDKEFYSDAYNALMLRSLTSGEEIELATHELELNCYLLLKEGEVFFHNMNLGKPENLLKRMQFEKE